MTGGPFAVDVEAALDALDLARGDEYDDALAARSLGSDLPTTHKVPR